MTADTGSTDTSGKFFSNTMGSSVGFETTTCIVGRPILTVATASATSSSVPNRIGDTKTLCFNSDDLKPVLHLTLHLDLGGMTVLVAVDAISSDESELMIFTTAQALDCESEGQDIRNNADESFPADLTNSFITLYPMIG